ncbi:imidazolonepropionase [Mycoplasmatota bacterium]|nr:imidazolonepropionase [Mycoplasmatota bacterium]
MDYGKPYLRGKELDQLKIVEHAYLYIVNDKVVDYGTMEEMNHSANVVIDCTNKMITPGLVDPHTHLIFGGSREKEIALKLQGASYLEILNMGLGIHSTVEATKNASINELQEKALKVIDTMNGFGVTSLECKSGYGLDEDTELKQLKALVNLTNNMNIKSTFLGAHAIPKDSDSKTQLSKMISFIEKYKDSNLFQFVDIFCEDSVFNIAESEEYLLKSKELGFGIRIHGDEIKPLGGAELAARIGANSADHLIGSSIEGIKALGKSNTVCNLLPGTSFYLNKSYAKARTMIDNNCIIGLSTDYNPGSSPCENIQFIMNLALLKYKMTPKEIWNAVTINPAYSLNLNAGTLKIGSTADFVIWNAQNHEYVVYHNAVNDVDKVYKSGKLIKEVV